MLSQENKIYHERTRKLLTEHTETLRRLDSTIGREHDKAKPPPSPPSPPPPIALKLASWAPPPGGLALRPHPRARGGWGWPAVVRHCMRQAEAHVLNLGGHKSRG